MQTNDGGLGGLIRITSTGIEMIADDAPIDIDIDGQHLSINDGADLIYSDPDSTNVYNRFTSKYYQCRNYTSTGSVTTTIGVADTYYTIKGLTNDTAFNMSYTDSTIVIPEPGLYLVNFHSSSHFNSNGEDIRLNEICTI